MNKFILSFFDAMSEAGISYCHFKSNNNLEPALNGVDDLDLLISENDVDHFNLTIATFGFRMATDRGDKPTPFVFHYFAVDPETGLLVHLHVYFKLISGGSILKNHWFRVERMFLGNVTNSGLGKVMVPIAEVDLIFFTIRKFIEQPSIVEHYLFLKDLKNIKAELAWLLARADKARITELLKQWLPHLEPDFFHACLTALESDSSIACRVMLGRKMRRHFQTTVSREWVASIRRSFMFLSAHLRNRLGFTRSNRCVFPGGRLIAFVGSEASGKSTCSKAVNKWLSKRFDVTHIHIGKPKANWRTKPLWFLITLYSSIKRGIVLRSGATQDGAVNLEKEAHNIPHPLVCLLDSFDRLYWLKRHLSHKFQGGILLVDRYPSDGLYAIDSARIVARGSMTSWMAKVEAKNYAKMPPPDLVFKMMAPLDVTLARNAQRDTPEPEGFVKQRYEKAQSLEFATSEVVEVNTNEDFDKTLLFLQNKIWNSHYFQKLS